MQIYSLEEVQQATREYFKGDELATNIWIKKYCLKNENRELLELTPDDMHKRLAKELSRIELKYPNPVSENEIYELLKDFKYIILGGSPMEGIGNNYKIQSLSNCYVIGNDEDSYGSIFKIDEEQTHIMRRRGGVGSDLSHLRPKGATTTCAAMTSTGIVPFAERYSNSTRETAQNGRRGARMLSLSVIHPDAEDFVDAKLEEGKITGANISVKITDEFMQCVREDKDFIQRSPIDSDLSKFSDCYDLNHFNYNVLYKLKNNSGEVCYIKHIESKKLWNKIIHNAWKSAEPGVLFIDQIQRESPSDCYGKAWETVSSNPCGEIPMNPYSSCILTSLNLYSYVNMPFTETANFDFDLFTEDIRIAQRLIDDIVDLEIEKIDQILAKVHSDPEAEDTKFREIALWTKIREKIVEGRRTGLGITAEGDMLAALGLRYGTEEATEFAVSVHKTLAVESYRSSIEMAKERGSFPIWDYEKEKDNPFIERVISELCDEHSFDYGFYGRRNIANLTIAPTGTVSLMTQTTSGVEPLFRPFYKRRTKIDDKTKATFIDSTGDAWQEYFVLHSKFVEWYDINWYKTSVKLFDLDYHKPIEDYSEAELEKLFEKSPYYGATANDIDWKASVTMQGAVQKWIDHSISKTVNVPESATVEQIDQIYREAHRAGCKGVTVYRDNCRSGVLVSEDKKKEEIFDYEDGYKRPQTIECDIYHKTALKQNWMVIVGKIDRKPYEIFNIKDVDNHIFPYKIENGTITKIKSETYRLEGYMGDKKYSIDNIIPLMSPDEGVNTRKYSSMLRHRIHPKYIVEQIKKYATIVSFDKVIQRVLETYVKTEDIKRESEKCPECGTVLIQQEGCKHCDNCGYSRCG